MKKLTSISLVAAMLFAVSACNATPSETEAEITTTVEETTEETTEATSEETTVETTVSPADEEPVIEDDSAILDIINSNPNFDGVANSKTGIPSNIVFSDWRFTSYKGLTFNNAGSTANLRKNVSAPVYAAGDTVDFTYVSIGGNTPLAIVSFGINDDGTFDKDSVKLLAYGEEDSWNANPYYPVNDVSFKLNYDSSFVDGTLKGNGSFTIPSDSNGKIYFIFDCRNMETLSRINYKTADDVVVAINGGNYLICAPIVVE